MRKVFITIASMAIAALAVLSCTKETIIPEPDTIDNPAGEDPAEQIPTVEGITINVIPADEASKTYAVDGTVPTIEWSSTDKISLFESVDGVIQGAAESAAADINEGKASFSTTLSWADAGGSSYKYAAVYPSNAIINYAGTYYIILPAEQTLVGNNFSEDSDILFSTPLDYGSTRVADGESVMFSFRRLGTVVRLRLNGITAGEKIRQVTLTAPTYIAGAIEYDPITSTVDPASAFADYASDTVILTVDDVVSTGDDVVWFRVMCDEAWTVGEEFDIEVITDKSVYKKEIILPAAVEFPDGGLTKFGVALASSKMAPRNVPYSEDFESGEAEDWTFFDNDGDGYNWFVSSSANTNSGNYALVSQSYVDYVGDLSPDNWAFTPPVQLTAGNYLSFWVRAENTSYMSEHYAVYIAEDSPLGAITQLIAETEYPYGSHVEVAADGCYQRCVVQIPDEFDNAVVCIGFRHFNCTDQYWLDIDDVTITEDKPYQDLTAVYEDYLGDWTDGINFYTVAEKVAGSSYSISGLTGQGMYEVEARFENHQLVLYEQVVSSSGNTDITIQGSNGYYPNYPWTLPGIVFSALYDEDNDKLVFTPGAGLVYYLFITYVSDSVSGYELEYMPVEWTPVQQSSAAYDDYLGEWTNGAKVYTVEQKVAGESYYIRGLKGQGSYSVEARFENHRLALYEQMVSSDGTTEVALQSSNGYYPTYPDGNYGVIFYAQYDDVADQLDLIGSVYYMFVTYVNQSRTGAEYETIPSTLIPYVPVADTNTYLYQNGFEDGVTGWSFFDADGDGYQWGLSTTNVSHTGDNTLCSRSWINNTVGAVWPDNYAFTPAIQLTTNNYLSFWVTASQYYPDEHYAVYVTNVAPDASNLITENPIFEQTYSKTAAVGGYLKELGVSDSGYQHYVIPIDGFDNQTVYIGFRHFSSYDNEFLLLDDVSVIEGDPVFNSAPAPAPARRVAAHKPQNSVRAAAIQEMPKLAVRSENRRVR